MTPLKAGIMAFVFVFFVSCYSEKKQGNSAQELQNKSAPVASTEVKPAISFVEDSANDVADDDGVKSPKKLSGMDLIGVQLETTGSELRVTFKSSSTIPTSIASDTSALWIIDAWSLDGSQGYQLAAKVTGSEWFVYIFDQVNPKNQYVRKPIIERNDLIVSFPLNQIPGLLPQFRWSAETEFERYHDKVPNDGKATFPR